MSNSETDSKRRATQRDRLVTTIVGLMAALVLCSMIALAIKMVAAGRGLETHMSFWLVKDSWLGFLVAMGCCAVAVIAGLAWRVIQQRREDRLWRRHNAKWAPDQGQPK